MAEQLRTKRQLKFVRAVCNAWDESGGCVMNNPKKQPCSKANCMVYPVAARALAQLDVRIEFAPYKPAMARKLLKLAKGPAERIPRGDILKWLEKKPAKKKGKRK